MSLAPTQEQQDIFDAFPKHHILKINACAGSGKSTTLRLLAEQNVMPSLYVCFNKANAVEAAEKFPSHVSCRTMHSLAYSEFGRQLQHKLTSKFVAGEPYVNKARSNTEIAKLYGVPDLRTSEDTMITARAIAGLVKMTVGRYQSSAHVSISEKHIPQAELMDISKKHPMLDLEKFKKIVVNFANKLWNDRVNEQSPVQAEHDTYLKLWQLSNPKLNYDIIYVDEAQDTNPVCFDILQKQESKMVYVGDSYQSIYAFRQAVNAMEKINSPFKVLSKSFRYGKDIADLATFIIKGGIQVKGLESIESRVRTFSESQYTIIFRTNSYLIGRAVDLITQGKKVYCNIDTRKFENQLNSVLALYEGRLKDVKDDDISIYSSWDEFVEILDEVPEYERLAEIVIMGLTYKYLRAVKQVKLNKDSYEILMTTAHKSKGMEWDNVMIADDFSPKCILCSQADPAYNQQEVNLFYVACTRAIKNLHIPVDFSQAFSKSKRKPSAVEGFDEDTLEDLAFNNEGCYQANTLPVDNLKLVQLSAGSHVDWSELRNRIGNPHLNSVVDMVTAGMGVALPNGGLAFPDEELAEEELRAHYMGY